jgi:hypothetical protein
MIMNPLRLLTKGRTIRGLKERPGAYKLLERSVLPNFSGPKRPAPTPLQPQLAKAQPALFEQPKPNPETTAPVRLTPVPAPVPAPAPVLVKDEPSKPGLWSRLAGFLAGWTRQWIRWRNAPPFQSPTVQTELALDKVRVIRNDLSEGDLEVVMMEKKAGNKTEKPAQSEEVEREKLTANP